VSLKREHRSIFSKDVQPCVISHKSLAIKIAARRLTGRSAAEEELIFFEDEDKNSKLACSLGEVVCNSHLESTVNCTGDAVASWSSSEMYKNVASTNGGVYSLELSIGYGGMNSRCDI